MGTAGGTTSIPSLTADVLRSASSDYAALDSGATQTSTATESSSGSSLTSYGVKSVRGDINNMTMRLIDEVTDFANPDDYFYERLMTSLRETRRMWMFLSAVATQRPYDICQSIRLGALSPVRGLEFEAVPASLHNINLILITNSKPVEYSTAEQHVWSGFDFVHCCTAVTVRKDLSYGVRGSEASLKAVRQRYLIFKQHVKVHCDRLLLWKQLKRVWKYVCRDFVFPMAPPCGTTTSAGPDPATYTQAVVFTEPSSTVWPFDLLQAKASGKGSDSGDSSADSSQTRSNIEMRSERVVAALRQDTAFDYWVECQGGTSPETDPVRISLSRSASGM